MPRKTTTKPNYVQCTHGAGDVVSSFVLRDGYWRDCINLPFLAHIATLSSTNRNNINTSFFRVVDIGGNIGTCATLVASRGGHVVTFEPVPQNYNLIIETVHANANLFRGRLQLFKAAASNVAQGTATITIESGNYGNSILIDAKAGKENAEKVENMIHQKTKLDITLTRIDDHIFHHVEFMKMDCQGCEYKALEGAATLFEKYGVDVVFFEMDSNLVRATGASPHDLLNFFLTRNYVLISEFENVIRRITRNNLEEMIQFCEKHALDIVALSPKLPEAAGGLVETLFKMDGRERVRLLETSEPNSNLMEFLSPPKILAMA